MGCRELATFVLFVTVALCQKYVCPATGGEVVRRCVSVSDGGVQITLLLPHLQVPNDVVCKYRSMFHPTAFLKREVGCGSCDHHTPVAVRRCCVSWTCWHNGMP